MKENIIRNNLLPKSPELSWLLELVISVLAGFLLFNISYVKVVAYGWLDPFVYLGYKKNISY